MAKHGHRKGQPRFLGEEKWCLSHQNPWSKELKIKPEISGGILLFRFQKLKKINTDDTNMGYLNAQNFQNPILIIKKLLSMTSSSRHQVKMT